MTQQTTVAAWLTDPATDWSAGPPARVADLLAAAYPEPSSIRSLASRSGVDAGRVLDGGPARDAWVTVLGSAARSRRVLHLVAEVWQDDGSREFRRPLRKLLGTHQREVDAIRWIKFGVEPVATPEGVEEVGDEPVGALEAITSAPSGLEDPRAVVQSLLEAMWRTAMIEVAGVPKGTGFLVGRDLVLTAAHVIDPRNWPPVPCPEVTARFDYILDPGTSLARTGVSVPVSEFVTGSLPAPEELDGATAAWDAPADRLDFALLRLVRPVPPVDDRGLHRARGEYALDPVEYDYAASPMLFIVQHPLGDTQRVTWVRSAAQSNGLRTRIRYGGNTLPGASGSPVVDLRGRLVGLHHFAAAGRNQAVPVAAIARAVAAGAVDDILARSADGGSPVAEAVPAARAADVDPFATTTVTGRAFVGRRPLRAALRRMATDDDVERILTIQGQSGSGMSYSYWLLAHVASKAAASAELRAAAPQGLAVVRLDLGSYVRTDTGERASRFMRELLHDLGLTYPGDSWAQISRDASSLERELRRGLRDSDRQWWVFVDGLESSVTVRQGGLDEAIFALAEAAADPDLPLRLVLVGREALTFASDHDLPAAEDIAAGFVRQDVEQWFVQRAEEEHAELSPQRLQALLDELFPPGGPLPAPCTVGPRLPRRLLELLEPDDGP